MFKKLIVITLLLWLLFFPHASLLSQDDKSVPASAELQAAPVIKLQFACVIPFDASHYRLAFGYTAKNHPQVDINLADIISDPFTDVSTGMRNTKAKATDKFYLTLVATGYAPIFVVRWTDLKTKAFTQMRFRSDDFKPCR